jgi:hypothetical protein
MVKLYTRSFNGGVITPEMYGRLDDVKNNTGLAECHNMIVLPQGPVVTRSGTQYVREVKDSTKYTRLIPFRFSSTQTMMIEAGPAYFRFHTFGATLRVPTAENLTAYNSSNTYNHGDIVKGSGATHQPYYAVQDVPTNTDPDTPANQYDPTPVVSVEWQATQTGLSSVPADFEYVGTELPTVAVAGQKIAISRVVYTYTDVSGVQPSYGYEPRFGGTISVPIPMTVYDTYTGVSLVLPSGYWMPFPADGTLSVSETESYFLYEIPSPYAENDLKDLHFVQSADVMTIVHPNYAPRELRREGATTWKLQTIAFGSTLSAPTISSVTATQASNPSDTQSYSYVATNVTDDQLDESVASAAVSATNQLFDTGAKNTINFSGAARRNVYKLSGGMYGFIGQTTTTSLVDDNIAPDMSKAPPSNETPFAADFPAAVAYFEQRRVFAGTTDKPQTFWMTKTGAESNLDYSIPVRDDDAISIRIAAREANTIRHVVPVGDLILFTESAEWRVTSVNSDAITPTTLGVRPQSYIGANNVQPVLVGSSAVYAAARGGHVRSLGYDFNVNSYVSVDMSVRAAHLFDYKTITDIAYSKGPVPIVWCLSSDGRLLGMTYVPEQQVYAWHTHATDGYFESIAVVGEGNDDILYAVVRREIDGVSKRYVERLSSRYFEKLEDYFGVDCGLTYTGSPATVISGLDHLEGKEVAILADGAVHEKQTVASGQVTLSVAASKVHIGLPIAAEIVTMPMAVEMRGLGAFGQSTPKSVNKATLRVFRSSGFSVGTEPDNIVDAKVRTTETYGSPPALQTGEIDVEIASGWTREGKVIVQQNDPVPLSIVSMTLYASFGG